MNPVIFRNDIPGSNSIFNSAVVPFERGFKGVFRCDDRQGFPQLHVGTSGDGINWQINPERIAFPGNTKTSPAFLGYDPRVVWIEDRFYVTWCNDYYGPTIGIAWTQDFKNFSQLENAFLPYNRNGVLFPRKIRGNYAMLSRPSDTGHTPFGDIFYSESPDMKFWGCHRHVMNPNGGWQSTKVGAGPTPIETSKGWLLFYHGVKTTCNGMIYSMGAAILDLDEPWNVLYRTSPYLMCPQEAYELAGDVPNVVFPCAALADSSSGRIAIYYGCADTVTGLAFCQVDELVEFVKANSRL